MREARSTEEEHYHNDRDRAIAVSDHDLYMLFIAAVLRGWLHTGVDAANQLCYEIFIVVAMCLNMNLTAQFLHLLRVKLSLQYFG